MTRRIAVCASTMALVVASCTTTVDLGNGVSQRGDHLYYYDGPELEVTLGTHQTARTVGEKWLVLAVLFRAVSPSGTLTIERSSVSVMTPDGHRLPLASQEEFRSAYSQIHTLVRRTEFWVPPSRDSYGNLRMCDRWFFADIGEGFATDELYLNGFEMCTGPLVFHVPRAIQPGRWRLLIELEESRADIPFEIDTSY